MKIIYLAANACPEIVNHLISNTGLYKCIVILVEFIYRERDVKLFSGWTD